MKMLSTPRNFFLSNNLSLSISPTFSLLESVVHANCADQVQSSQKDELLLDELLGDEVTECDKDENPSGYCGGIEPARTAAFCVSNSRAHV